MGIFRFGREKAPGSLSAEEIEKAIRYGFIDEGDEALAQKHPDYYRTLIADKEKSIQSSAEEIASEPLVSEEKTESEIIPGVGVINVDEVLETEKSESKDEEPLSPEDEKLIKDVIEEEEGRAGESNKVSSDSSPVEEVHTTESAPAKSEPVLKRRRFGWLFGKGEKQKVEDNPETAQSYLEKPEPESSIKPPEEIPTIAEPEEGKVVAEEGKKEEPIVSEQKDEVLPPEKISRDDEILPDTEKYGKTFELREKIKESRRARANLVIIEEELNRKRKWKFGISTKGVKELEAKYEKAKSNYEEKRAEYIGAKTWRLLKEKQRLAEAEARKYEISHKSEKYFLEKWRKLGEKNLLTLLGKEGWNPTTRRGKAAKFLAKSLSARVAISSTLLGVGVLAGAGSVVGIGAFVGRRALSGVGSTVGTYDLLNLLGEKRNPDKTSELISRIENTPGEVTDEEIERKMAELEVKAKYKGERIVHSDEYEKLKKEYFKRVESKSDREDVIKKVLLELRLDKQVEAEKTKIEKVDTRNKLIAGTVGTIVSTGALAEMLKYIRSIPGGEDVSIDEIERATQHGPALNEDTARALAEQEPALPDPTLDAAQKVCLVNPPGSESLIPRGLLPNVETPAVPPVPVDTPDNLVDVKILGGETITIAEDHIGVVKRGGSAWQAAREMVRSRAISQEEFARAWSSAASTVELPSGQTIHISDLALVHEGNQVLYIPEANGVPAHFEVADYAGKTLRVGSNADLARAFDAAGRPRPAWLERAVGAAQETAREAVTAPPTVDLPDIQPDLTPAGIDAANDSISISPEAVTDSADVGQVPNPEDVSVDTPEVPVEGTAGNDVIDRAAENAYESREALRFSWGGHVDIVYNTDGQIDGYIIDTENVSAFNKARVVERAVATSFNSNYEEVLDASVRDSLRGALGEGPAFENGVAEIWPDVSAQAKELAFRIDTLRRVFDRAEPNSPEWMFLRDELRRLARPDPNYSSSLILGGMRVSASIFKPNIIP